VGASNELPREEGELAALYDRFLVRLFVDNLDEDKFIDLLEFYDQSPRQLNPKKITEPPPLFSIEELKELQNPINHVILPDFIKNYLKILRIKLKSMNQEILQKSNVNSQNVNTNLQDTSFRDAYVSERRWGKIVKLLKASAWLNNRDYVSVWDLLLLPECVTCTKDHIEAFPRKLLVDWNEVVNKAYLKVPLSLPTEADLRQLEQSQLIQLKDSYEKLIISLTAELSLLKDLEKALEEGFNKEDNASTLNIWLTPHEFTNRLIEWGKHCSQTTVIESKLTTLEEQLKALEKLLELLKSIIVSNGGNGSDDNNNGGNYKTIITGETITCSIGNAEIVFVKVQNHNNDGYIYISEIPITLKIFNDIKGESTAENTNKIITKTIPDIENFITQINTQPISLQGNSLRVVFRLPTQQEYKLCVLGNLKIPNEENLLSALNENRTKIYHRGSRDRTENQYLQEVENGRMTLNFCPYLKSPLGYKSQVCTINNLPNQYISMGGSTNSTLQGICDSILNGRTINTEDDNSVFSFRLILEINN
jgi:hypothetical protein